MKRLFLTSLAVIAASLLAALGPTPAAQALEPAPIGSDERAREDQPFTAGSYFDAYRNKGWWVIKANGLILFGIPVKAGGYTPKQRATEVCRRLEDLYMHDVRLSMRSSYVVGLESGELTLRVKVPASNGQPETTLLLTVNSNVERFLGHSKRDIAYYWRDLSAWRMRQAGIKADPFSTPKDMLGRPLKLETYLARYPGWLR